MFGRTLSESASADEDDAELRSALSVQLSIIETVTVPGTTDRLDNYRVTDIEQYYCLL